jgi:hypothetical protein
MRTIVLKDVTETDVKRVVDDFESEGATVLAPIKQKNGKYILTIQIRDYDTGNDKK